MDFRGSSSRGFGGRGRGRGRNRGGWHSGHKPPVLNGPTTRTDPLGPVIDNINIKKLIVDDESPKIENVDYISSYNWVDGKSPKILVPGSPPAWTPPSTDPQLKSDRREAFWDLNAARWPPHPLEPAIRSVEAMQPGFDLPLVDIFGCSYTLSKLLDVALSKAEPFRFDVDIIGQTVFFTRRGASPTELIADLRGYGFRFPEVYTTWDSDVRDSVSHQRIINFTFGGLNILLRSGTSGYLPASVPTNKPMTTPDMATPVEDAISKMSMNNFRSSTDHEDLRLDLRGAKVPQNRTFDLKTRGTYNIIDMNTMLPRLWLSQTPNFLVAYHTHGLFDKPQVNDVRADVLRWESDNRSALAQFHALIKRIIDTVQDMENDQGEVSWKGDGELLITERIEGSLRVLPDDLCHLFVRAE